MFIYISQIDIGATRFNFNSQCHIESGYEMLGDTCRITLPQAISFGNRNFIDVVKKGMPVQVRFGYRDDFDTDALGLKLEFVGYVDQTGTKAPFTIDCIDEMFTLRRRGPLNLNYPNGVGLRKLIKDIAPGYQYDIDDSITLGPLRIEETNAVSIFAELQQQGIYVYFIPPTSLYFKNRPYTPVLHAGLAYRQQYRRVLFATNQNVAAGGDGTEYTVADTQKLVIKAISNRKDNTKQVYYYPPGLQGAAETRTLNKYNVSLDTLKRMAEDEWRNRTRAGYTGTLRMGTGVPVFSHGDVAVIDKPEYADKNGDYIIDRVSTDAGADSGIKRVATLGGAANASKRS